jgi:UrcA family protein
MTISKTRAQSRLTHGPVRAFAVALTLAATALPLSAFAATTQKISATAYGESVSVSVPTDLLATEEGAAKLYRALELKAKSSCKRTIPQRLGRSVNMKRCAGELMDGFVDALDDANITALHTETT